jgi:hypothetical protein
MPAGPRLIPWNARQPARPRERALYPPDIGDAPSGIAPTARAMSSLRLPPADGARESTPNAEMTSVFWMREPRTCTVGWRTSRSGV